jgi:hypothetical protein
MTEPTRGSKPTDEATRRREAGRVARRQPTPSTAQTAL